MDRLLYAKESFDFCGSVREHDIPACKRLLRRIVEEVMANDCCEINVSSRKADSWSDARNYTIVITTVNPAA